MRDAADDTQRRTDEAAGWFTRLNTHAVSTATVEAFFAWRQDPLNRAAYERIEGVSGVARTLRDDPEIGAVADEIRRRQARRLRVADALRGRTAVIGASLVAAGVVAAIVLAPRLLGQSYATGVGEQKAFTLADGSTVRLDTDSALRVRFRGGTRGVTLDRGQAFFEVAHDATKPFIVSADGAQVRAIGTAFDVRRSGKTVEVTLARGRVQVSSPAGGFQPVVLLPGQQLRLGNGSPPKPMSADLETATAWTSGRLLFRDAPLWEAVAEINRYNRRQIALAPGTPSGVKVSGAFDTGDVDGFAAAAADSLGLSVNPRPDGGLDLKPRGSAAP